jgi:hypothetical protein
VLLVRGPGRMLKKSTSTKKVEVEVQAKAELKRV